MSRIVVTGANGKFGRRVVEGLLTLVDASAVGVSVRDPGKARELEARGVRVTRGDFAEPSTLHEAFDGAEQVLLVSVNAVGEAALQQHRNAIRAARDAKVKRILYTSHQAASASSRVVFSRDHAATEDLLRESGVPFVSLRNGFYAESAMYQLGAIKKESELSLPEDGPVSWTAREDLADAAVSALTRQTLFDGITPPLTADAAVTFAEVAAMASEVVGRQIRRVAVSDETYQRGLEAHGTPASFAAMLVTMFEAIREGEFAVVDPTLENVLGRKPTALKAVLREFLLENAAS